MSATEPPDIEYLKMMRDVDALCQALRYQSDGGVRAQAADALGGLGDSQAVEALLAALGDQDRSVRRAAARALEDIEHSELVPTLPDRALAGEWGVAHSALRLKIVARRKGIRITARDLANGESLEVRDVSWNGMRLEFTTAVPSTGWTVEHVLHVADERTLQGYRMGGTPGRETLTKDFASLTGPPTLR